MMKSERRRKEVTHPIAELNHFRISFAYFVGIIAHDPCYQRVLRRSVARRRVARGQENHGMLDAFPAFQLKQSIRSTNEKEMHFAIPATQAVHSHLPGIALRNPNLRARKPHHSYHDTEKERCSHPNC
jgi:hypothetical protein